MSEETVARPISRRTILSRAVVGMGGWLGGCGSGSTESMAQPPSGGAMPVTALTLSGPSSSVVGLASAACAVSLAPSGGSIDGLVTVIPSDGGQGGTFDPPALVLSAGAASGSFSYTARSLGQVQISVTNNRGLASPAALSLRPHDASATPLALGFDTATPHQLSLRCRQSRALAAGSTAHAWFKTSGSATWRDAGLLYQVKDAEGAAPGEAGFAGFILDATPGTTYDLRVDITEPGVGSWQLNSAHATRALPPEGASPSGAGIVRNCSTAAAFTSALASAVPGDVIVLANGTYTVNSLNFNSPGTAANPVVIRGASRTGAVIVCTSGHLLQLSGSHTVIEHLTLRGSRVDSGTASASRGIVFSGARRTNNTIRHCTFDGFDRGIKAFDPVDGMLVYDCEFIGNNTHDTLVSGDATGQGWSDDGVGMPGTGNCVWNCTFSGHGDVIKLGDQSHAERSRACYVHHIYVKWSADDGTEFDDAGGNCALYNSIICNTATAFSADGTYGGPFGIVRNVFINQARHPMKLTSTSQGVRMWNNTIVSTNKISADHNRGLRIPNAVNHGLDYRNNLLTYRGSGDLVYGNGSLPGLAISNNAWYPNRAVQWTSSSGSHGSVETARAALAPVMSGDIAVPADPFATPITLGATFATRYDGHTNATLAAGSTARNGGVPLPGITDGFSGHAPDVGAFVSGQAFGTVGCAWA
ncbi:MAG: hypothetical protein HUU30_18955, partial [Burkholderiaceae bacterium]|nr:hypothetical protein [Burkholderiaceae bacterium]